MNDHLDEATRRAMELWTEQEEQNRQKTQAAQQQPEELTAVQPAVDDTAADPAAPAVQPGGQGSGNGTRRTWRQKLGDFADGLDDRFVAFLLRIDSRSRRYLWWVIALLILILGALSVYGTTDDFSDISWFMMWFGWILGSVIVLTGYFLLVSSARRRKFLGVHSGIGQHSQGRVYETPVDGAPIPDELVPVLETNRNRMLIPWRLPPLESMPKRPREESVLTGFAARLYWLVAVVFGMLWLVLHMRYVPDGWPWWLYLLPLSVMVAACVFTEYFVAAPIVKKRNDRRGLYARQYDNYKEIMWPAAENQGITDRQLWKLLWVLRANTHFIRFVTRSSRWQLLRKVRKQIYAMTLLLLGYVVFRGLYLLVYLGSRWMDKPLPATPPWNGWFVGAVIVGAVVITGFGFNNFMDWYCLKYMQTDEWLHVVRVYPVWMYWKNDETLAVQYASIASVNPENQPKGKVLRFGIVRIGAVKQEDDDQPSSATRLEFDELRFMVLHLYITWLIGIDLQRNLDEGINAQLQAISIAEDANELNREQIRQNGEIIENQKLQLEYELKRMEAEAEQRRWMREVETRRMEMDQWMAKMQLFAIGRGPDPGDMPDISMADIKPPTADAKPVSEAESYLQDDTVPIPVVDRPTMPITRVR